MVRKYEYRVVSGDLERQIQEMAENEWRFVWAGHYDLLPYIVFEREADGE